MPACAGMTIRSGLKNIPSPHVNGERAGVRGGQFGGVHRYPLTLTLSPEKVERGFLR